MASITIRNLPDSILSRIRTISELEKRSLNSELLLLIERGLSVETERVKESSMISKESQIKLWESLSGEWEDERSTSEIIDDIYAARTMGRDINL